RPLQDLKAELYPKGEVPLYGLLPRSPLRIGTFGERGGDWRMTGTCSHFRSDWKQKVSFLPLCSLLGHVTGPRRLQDHSSSTALLAHAQ
ncbi:unnamed protein product, partial [Staurois parvus]